MAKQKKTRVNVKAAPVITLCNISKTDFKTLRRQVFVLMNNDCITQKEKQIAYYNGLFEDMLPRNKVKKHLIV